MNPLKIVISTSIAMIITFCIAAFIAMTMGCKSQAVKYDGELGACYQDRYRAREGFPSETIALECSNAYKWERCMTAIKEDEKKDFKERSFKDFNDCWSKGK